MALKLQRVLPIYKKGSHVNLSNYRPISLLSIFNRILETLIYHRHLKYINKHNILYNIPLLFLLYINDFQNTSKLFAFHLFADDANLFFANKSLVILERELNSQLININEWLCTNEVSLNIDKSNFLIFHAVQKSKLN